MHLLLTWYCFLLGGGIVLRLEKMTENKRSQRGYESMCSWLLWKGEENSHWVHVNKEYFTE